MLHHISWIFVALSLIGNVYVIRKNVLGQWLWAISNIGWITFDILIGAYSQAFLFAAYLGLCIWGIISWSKSEKPVSAKKPAKKKSPAKKKAPVAKKKGAPKKKA